jgi:copper homeostasis protein
MILEVAVGSLAEAVHAISHGADRIELCHALSTGGVTPSPGSFLHLRNLTDLPIFVMLASPEADFNPTDPDFDAMIHDAVWFAENGADGLVFGCITDTNEIDQARNATLIEAASGLPCTFHRAFDTLPGDQLENAQHLASLGFRRILTSGSPTSIDEGTQALKKLFQQTAIQILPGGGVRPENAKALQSLGATELHFSIRTSSNRQGYLGYPLPEFIPNRITRMREALA